MTKMLIFLLLLVFGFYLGNIFGPQPLVCTNPIYQKAWHWCDEQIYQGHDVEYFTQAKWQIENREIRWSIDDPAGLHYTLLVTFAKAWDDLMEKESVTPEEFSKSFGKPLKKAPPPKEVTI